MTKSSVEKILLTKHGYDTLVEEYEELTQKRRPQVVEDIQKARELGDLSENGYYSAAREKQAFVEGRIKEIEDILKRVSIIEEDANTSNIVGLGSKVKVEIQKQTVEYHIVGPTEVDSAKGKISHESPIGKALIGKKCGDVVKVTAPMGDLSYKIVDIKY